MELLACNEDTEEENFTKDKDKSFKLRPQSLHLQNGIMFAP